MTELSGVELGVLLVAALLVGLAKTALAGVGLVSVALFASVLPARASTGALLLLLLVGDVVAVRLYRRHTDWPALLRLVPSVVVGVLLGVAFLARSSDTGVRRTIGVVLLVLVAAHVLARRRAGASVDAAGPPPSGPVPAPVFGSIAGFTTMVANAGGPAMALYLLAARQDRLAFLGTSAWFFLVINAVKVPFSVGLGLVDRQVLLLDAVLAPAVLLGAALGHLVARRLSQVRFEQAVLALTVLAALNLVR